MLPSSQESQSIALAPGVCCLFCFAAFFTQHHSACRQLLAVTISPSRLPCIRRPVQVGAHRLVLDGRGSPLMTAVKAGRKEVIEVLLAAGARIDVRDDRYEPCFAAVGARVVGVRKPLWWCSDVLRVVGPGVTVKWCSPHSWSLAKTCTKRVPLWATGHILPWILQVSTSANLRPLPQCFCKQGPNASGLGGR